MRTAVRGAELRRKNEALAVSRLFTNSNLVGYKSRWPAGADTNFQSQGRQALSLTFRSVCRAALRDVDPVHDGLGS
jgi:hypothetical protein